MSFGHNCQFQSSQCNIREVMYILMNVFISFCPVIFEHLIFTLAAFIKRLMKCFSNYVILSESSLINSQKLLQNQLHLSFSFAKIENVIISLNWMQEVMAKQKKKRRYSSEYHWFPEYYIGSIGISNCGQKTSTKGGYSSEQWFGS